MAKTYDIVVFGATGYTGGLVVDHLAEHVKGRARWAIAARDQAKLRRVAERASARAGFEVPCLVADSGDRASLDAMARSTAVLLTTVGPFLRYGEPVVAACVDAGTDYVDVTGEPEFVADIIARHDQRARAAGVRVIPCCGFDSVPVDMGVHFVMEAMRPRAAVEVDGYVHASFKLSGGTWQTMVGGLSRWSSRTSADIPHHPDGDRRVQGRAARPRFEPEVSGWVVPVPAIDPQIVLRSAASLDVYGPDFSYGHFLRVGSIVKLGGLAAGVGLAMGVAQLPLGRDLLAKIRPSGEGADEAQRQAGFFRITVVARGGGEQVIGRVSGGDAYAETATMSVEAALALVEDRDRLPARAGVLTPASAFEGILSTRLQAMGIRFDIVRRTRQG